MAPHGACVNMLSPVHTVHDWHPDGDKYEPPAHGRQSDADVPQPLPHAASQLSHCTSALAEHAALTNCSAPHAVSGAVQGVHAPDDASRKWPSAHAPQSAAAGPEHPAPAWHVLWHVPHMALAVDEHADDTNESGHVAHDVQSPAVARPAIA